MSRRLPDIVELFSRQFREIRTFIKHPGAILRMQAFKRARSTYENIELPGGQTKKESPLKDVKHTNESRECSYGVRDKGSLGPKPKDGTQDGIDFSHSDEGRDSVALGAFSVLPLPEASILSGSQWYKYTIGQLVRDDQWVRWYSATNQADEPVIIQEYVLPNTEFSSTAIEERQAAFVQFTNFNINVLNGPGEGRDFRLLKLIEAFSSTVQYETAYCYLVAKPLPGIPLQEYLDQHGYWNSGNIREALRQVLQSLQFLHTGCRIKFSNTHIERGIPHGNLSLESLFIRQSDLVGVNSDRKFFIHIADLLLWEHIIHPPSSPKFHSKIAESSDDIADKLDDLTDLGRIGFQLVGCTVDPDHNNDIVELRNGQAQTILKDDPLYHFLCRLMGKDAPIKTVDDAIEVLRKLPKASSSSPQTSSALVDTTKHSRFTTPWGLPLVVLALLFMGTMAWLLFSRNRQAIVSDAPPPSLEKPKPNKNNNSELYLAAALAPQRPIRYQIESEGVWQDVMWSKISTSNSNQVKEVTQSLNDPDELLKFIAELKNRQPQLQLSSSGESRFQSKKDILKFVSQSSQNVGLIRLSETEKLPPHLKKTTIAYDGLAALVTFRDAYHTSNSISEQLEGYITLDELRELYTSENLHDVTLNRKGKNYSVELYFPTISNSPEEYGFTNNDTIKLFIEQVLNDDQKDEDAFNDLREEAIERDQDLIVKERLTNKQKLQNNIYEKMFYTQEKIEGPGAIISISFDRLSRAFEQCTLYPLKIRDIEDNNTQFDSQALVDITGTPIQANVDLCGGRDSYYVDLQQNPLYPLRYELALVYQKGSKEGETFGAMLSTHEAQYLFSEMGLVPAVASREDLWNFVWGENNADG